MEILKKLTDDIGLKVGLNDQDVNRATEQMEQTLNKVIRQMFLQLIIAAGILMILAYFLFQYKK